MTTSGTARPGGAVDILPGYLVRGYVRHKDDGLRAISLSVSACCVANHQHHLFAGYQQSSGDRFSQSFHRPLTLGVRLWTHSVGKSSPGYRVREGSDRAEAALISLRARITRALGSPIPREVTALAPLWQADVVSAGCAPASP